MTFEGGLSIVVMSPHSTEKRCKVEPSAFNYQSFCNPGSDRVQITQQISWILIDTAADWRLFQLARGPFDLNGERGILYKKQGYLTRSLLQ